MPAPATVAWRQSASKLSFLSASGGAILGMGDRVVDCARLESVCAERHRGFESLPIRISLLFLLGLSFAPFENLQLLSQFDDTSMWKYATKIYAWINDAITADYCSGVNHGVATDFCAVADDRPELG